MYKASANYGSARCLFFYSRRPHPSIFRALRASAAVPFFRRCTWPQLHWHAAVLCTVCVTVVPVRGSWCTNTLSTISRGARCGETPVLPSILSDRVTAGSRDFVVIERIVKHDEY